MVGEKFEGLQITSLTLTGVIERREAHVRVWGVFCLNKYAAAGSSSCTDL